MIPISHMPSPRSRSILFHHWFNLLILHSGVLNNSYGISRLHSQHLETGEEFLLNLGPFSWRFVVLASCHPHYCSDCEEFFYTHPKHFMNSFLCDPPKAIISEDFFVLSFQLRPPNILHWCLFVRLHILTVVLSRLPFRCYRFNSFVLFTILPVVRWRFTQACARSLLILSNENK